MLKPSSATTYLPTDVERHSAVILIEAINSNPNGDPDFGGAPRQDRDTKHGIITDVSIKRKVRDVWSLMGLPIFIARGSVLEENKLAVLEPVINSRKDVKKKPQDERDSDAKLLLEHYIDLRTFGGVLASKDKALDMDAVRGPVQIGIGRTIDPITINDIQLTRCAAQKADETKDNKTFGSKAVVPYGLYRVHMRINPFLARRTGFSKNDLTSLRDIMTNLYGQDAAAGRGEVYVRGIHVFKDADPLGSVQDRVLLDSVKVTRRAGVETASSFDDYEVTLPSEKSLPKGITFESWVS
jgi:CRISPR-associated protein Csd2